MLELEILDNRWSFERGKIAIRPKCRRAEEFDLSICGIDKVPHVVVATGKSLSLSYFAATASQGLS